MCGYNRFVDDLRILIALELNSNPVLFSKHLSFITLTSKQGIPVSHNDLDSTIKD